MLPAVTDVRDQTGTWDAVGDSRTLVLSDGGTVRETLRVVDPPSFAYDLTHFTGFFGRLVASGGSVWRIGPRDDGGTIEWTYTFVARRGWGVAVALIMRLAWAPYMRRVLPAIAASTQD